VLSEEKRLPLEWVADILEQVCSAVHEAHQQSIIHRDLKPDNIWLEPNRLGSYRVKVLDFGIAKLGEAGAPVIDDDPAATIIMDEPAAVVPANAGTNLETDTLLRTDEQQSLKANANGDGVATLLQDSLTNPLLQHTEHHEDDGTLIFDQATRAGRQTQHGTTIEHASALTRVGAIMGTPLYMSPEQCGGGLVDTRSDIYSLGVIAYQMLAGEVPFAGNTSTVMRAHREQQPQELRERANKIPKRAAGVVMSALSKNPAQRPQTAFAFASALRGQSEGIGALYRRAFSLYSEYFPKFAKLTIIAHIPVLVTTLLLIALMVGEKYVHGSGMPAKVMLICGAIVVALLHIVAYMIAGAMISGVTAVIITQLSAAPLRPVKLRVAFGVLRRRWRPFVKTMLLVTLRIVLWSFVFVIPGIVAWIRYFLYAPVVLIEGLEKKAAMKRARQLASRSWRMMIFAAVLQVLIPAVFGALVGRIKIGNLQKDSTAHQIYQQILGLGTIFVMPLISIVPALLYLKMRQLGGEPLSAVLAQFEEGEDKQSAWQQRM
ncbi:MAG TPA: serine/threonine-protein kinase, partial [Pyrinomonadaceae bacterium]|nr:serine/threonine-protein kinase [Pyrinomonadaceae bacterium]